MTNINRQSSLRADAPADAPIVPPPPRLLPFDRKIAVIGYIFFCLNALFFGYLSVASLWGYDVLTREDSWVEDLTAVWLLLTGLVLFITALAEQNFLRRCAYVLGGIGFVFGAGEEISWGQRILGFETPDFLLDLNAQNEFNAHNINLGTFETIYIVGTQMLCIVTCAAFFARKDRLLGVPLPSILLVLGFLTALSYQAIAQPNFVRFIIREEKGLLLLFAIFSLLSGQSKLFIAAVATAALVAALSYANHFGDASSRGIGEVREYLFSLPYLFYSLQLLLAQEPARTKLSVFLSGFRLSGGRVSLLRGIEVSSSGRTALLRRIPIRRIPLLSPNFMWTPWLVVCLAIIAASIGLVPFEYFIDKAKAARIEEGYQAIMSREPSLRSDFDVYLIGNELTYFKNPCVPADTDRRFFLHVVPADVDDLPRHRKLHSFDNLDFNGRRKFESFDGKCLVIIPLPDYAIVSIRTGQYIRGEGRIWEGEITVGR